VSSAVDWLLGGVVVLAVVLATARRFGALGRGGGRAELTRYVAERGFVLTAGGDGFEAVVDALRVTARVVVTPAHVGRSITWIVEARARQPVDGCLALRPKHEDAPAGLRVGDADFDQRFLIEGTSYQVAAQVLGETARRALIDFGPHGESSYERGAFRLEWEAPEEVPWDQLDRALRIVTAVCGTPAGYRAPDRREGDAPR
jgi:hypothetical protein